MRIRIRHLFLFYGGTGMKKIIELKNITKSFDGEVVLDHIDLDIYDNEFLTLLGPSGCGKTTTLRLIGGFETADEGDIIFMGENINNMPPHKRNVNTVFQRYALFPHLNVFENVAFPLREKRVPKAEVEQRVKEMLSMVALTGFEHRSVTSLSGGQQQRVAIARALISRPKVLLLDEPLAALDLKLRKDMQQELKNIQKAMGITFVFVTHDQEEALSMSDTVVVMSGGNNGAWADETKSGNLYSDDVNFQTGGSPGSYPNGLTVASVNNDGVVGYSFQVNGKSWYVTSSRVTENNTSYRKIAVTAERYVLCTATEAATGIGSTAD